MCAQGMEAADRSASAEKSSFRMVALMEGMAVEGVTLLYALSQDSTPWLTSGINRDSSLRMVDLVRDARGQVQTPKIA